MYVFLYITWVFSFPKIVRKSNIWAHLISDRIKCGWWIVLGPKINSVLSASLSERASFVRKESAPHCTGEDKKQRKDTMPTKGHRRACIPKPLSLSLKRIKYTVRCEAVHVISDQTGKKHDIDSNFPKENVWCYSWCWCSYGLEVSFANDCSKLRYENFSRPTYMAQVLSLA